MSQGIKGHRIIAGNVKGTGTFANNRPGQSLFYTVETMRTSGIGTDVVGVFSDEEMALEWMKKTIEVNRTKDGG